MLHLIAQVDPQDLDQFIDIANVTAWDVLWAAISIVVGIVAGRIARLFARKTATSASLSANLIDLLGTMAMWTIVAIGVVVALSFLGLTLAPLWILLLLIGFVVVIGGRSLLENFGAGVLLQSRAPFTPGDLVEVGGDSGVVKEVNSRVVVLDTYDGRRVFVPNSTALEEPIVNLTHRTIRMSELVVDVTYGTDLDAAAALMVEALSNHEALSRRPTPTAQVSAFESSSVRYVVRFWHRSDLASQWNACDVAARSIYRTLNDADISFAFPQQTLWWGNGEEPSST